MGTGSSRAALLARVRQALTAFGRRVVWLFRDVPVMFAKWLAANASRAAAVVWLGGLATFVGVAGVRTWTTVSAQAAIDRAKEAERERQLAMIHGMELTDVSEWEGEKDRQLRKYGAEFNTMIVDAGPPGDAAVKTGGIAGWVARNKKHASRKVSDKETLKLLREEMGEDFGALAELAESEDDPLSVAGTMHRMKQISRLRGGQGSRAPSKELMAEMGKQGFDRDLMGTAVDSAGADTPPLPGEAPGVDIALGVDDGAGAQEAPEDGDYEAPDDGVYEAPDDGGETEDLTDVAPGAIDDTAPSERPASPKREAKPPKGKATPPKPKPTPAAPGRIAVTGFDIMTMGDAAATGLGLVVWATAASIEPAKAPPPAPEETR